MKPQEGTLNVGFDKPAIQGVERTGNQEQTVTEIAEPLHNKTRMAKPSAAATSSLRNKIISTTLPDYPPPRQYFF
jgi:hypothetical protein